MIPIIRKPTVLITIPRTTEPPTRVPAQPPRHLPSKARLCTLLPPVCPARLCPGPSGTAGAKVTLHQLLISCPTAFLCLHCCPFYFPLHAFFCLDWWRPRCSSSSWEMSHAPNILRPIKSEPGCLLELHRNLTARAN